MTPSDYELRPKIEVVKANMRGSITHETRMDNHDINEPTVGQFPSREIKGEGPSCKRREKPGEVLQKRSFDQAFTGRHSEEFSNTPMNPPMTTSSAANTRLPSPNVDFGMEFWNGPRTSPIVGQEASRPQSVPGTFAHTAANMSFHDPSSDGGSTEFWVQDEKELKRQKRKEANRESARRSRMRKQAECDELSEKVQALTVENESLRMEVDRLSGLCQKLSSENLLLLERLKK